MYKHKMKGDIMGSRSDIKDNEYFLKNNTFLKSSYSIFAMIIGIASNIVTFFNPFKLDSNVIVMCYIIFWICAIFLVVQGVYNIRHFGDLRVGNELALKGQRELASTLREEKSSLNSRVSKLEKTLKKREKESDDLYEKSLELRKKVCIVDSCENRK